jgi:hypothetical protein
MGTKLHGHYETTRQVGSAEESFIAKAPDAVKPGRWQRGNKTQITLSIAPELLERLDEVARRKYVSRAALVAMWQ